VSRQHDLDEFALIERVIGGDRSAFALLVEAQIGRLIALATNMLASASEAQDCIQTVLASVWMTRERLDPERPIAPYLTTITLNKCRDRLRRRKAAQFLRMGNAAEDRYAVDSAPSPETIAGDRRLMAQVQAEIERLPVNLREALVLVCVDGRSQREAAALIGVSEKTIETRVYRARQKLRKRLNI